MPMVVTDPRQPDNPIVLANRSFLDETGYSSEEVIGRNCRFLQGPQTDPDAVDKIRAAVSAEQEITIELINHRKDGTPFWNQLYISPIYDDDGKLIYFSPHNWTQRNDIRRRASSSPNISFFGKSITGRKTRSHSSRASCV